MTCKMAIVLWAAVSGCSGVRPRPVPPPQSGSHGHLLLLGGGSKPAAFVERFVALAGGSSGRIVVLPMASGDSRLAGAEYLELFHGHGVKDVRVVHIDDRRDALRTAYLDLIGDATGVFFTGGDQSRIAARIVDTPLLDAVRAVRDRGGVIGGTSAGLACQSAIMLVGEGDERVLRMGNIGVAPGLGLFEGVILDSHFVARRRFNRLLSVVLEHPEQIGVGVDEATAVWVKPDHTFEVIGDSQVLVYDATAATVTEVGGRLAVSGLRQSVLLSGQRYDLARHMVMP